MKLAIFFFFLFSTTLFISCEKLTAPNRIYEDVSSKKDSVFLIRIEVQVPRDDTFSLFYTTDNSLDFTKIKPLWMPIKGQAASQEVVFSLPKKTIPKEIRIDFGNNKDQGNIFVKRIKISYNGKTFDAPGTLIFSYFRPDFTKTKFDATSGLLSGVVKNGIRQSPSLYPKEGILKEEIEKLVDK